MAARGKTTRMLRALGDARVKRRMAGAAALCAAGVAVGAAPAGEARLEAGLASRRALVGDAVLLFPQAVSAALGSALWKREHHVEPERIAASAVDSWLLTSRRIQRDYELQGVIGEGGFGLVHLGRHKESDARVAIKRVSKRLTSKEKFVQEVDILKQVGGSHNVLELHEAFETTDAYVLVTELVEGGELFDELVEHGVFNERKAKTIVREIAIALDFLHSEGVVHADVKPENILLTNSKDLPLRLIDFGQAFRVAEPSERQRVDVGTTAYASPEFIQQQDVSYGIDVWALGVVLFILLCGRHPFDPTDGASDEEIQRRILAGDFDRDCRGWRYMSSSARELIQRMLTVDASQRISAADVLQHEWVAGAVKN